MFLKTKAPETQMLFSTAVFPYLIHFCFSCITLKLIKLKKKKMIIKKEKKKTSLDQSVHH